MVDAYRDGDLRSATPEEIITPYPKSEASDDAEVVEAWPILELTSGGYVMGQARLRNFNISGVTPRSLASSVAVADAGRQLALVLAGDHKAFGAGDLRALRARTKGWMHQGGSVSDADRRPRLEPPEHASATGVGPAKPGAPSSRLHCQTRV